MGPHGPGGGRHPVIEKYPTTFRWAMSLGHHIPKYAAGPEQADAAAELTRERMVIGIKPASRHARIGSSPAGVTKAVQTPKDHIVLADSFALQYLYSLALTNLPGVGTYERSRPNFEYHKKSIRCGCIAVRSGRLRRRRKISRHGRSDGLRPRPEGPRGGRRHHRYQRAALSAVRIRCPRETSKMPRLE